MEMGATDSSVRLWSPSQLRYPSCTHGFMPAKFGGHPLAPWITTTQHASPPPVVDCSSRVSPESPILFSPIQLGIQRDARGLGPSSCQQTLPAPPLLPTQQPQVLGSPCYLGTSPQQLAHQLQTLMKAAPCTHTPFMPI